MDIEELNKFQIVLLTLLVSFVTSIATGIVTVTLLAQAPPAVTQTINHVIDRTIETVVPQATSTKQTTVTQTVVEQEDDLVTSAIASAMQKTGRVFGGTATSSPVVGLAAEIAPNVLVTDAALVSTDHLVSIGNVSAVFTVSQTFPDIGVAVLVPAATSTSLSTPFKVADIAGVKLGETATAILSVTNARVAIGAVSAEYPLADVTKKGAATVSVRAVDTNLDAGGITGSPLFDIYGNLIGISTAASQNAGGKGTFVSASDIISVLAAKSATTTPAAQ
jgi:hypothetical protein